MSGRLSLLREQSCPATEEPTVDAMTSNWLSSLTQWKRIIYPLGWGAAVETSVEWLPSGNPPASPASVGLSSLLFVSDLPHAGF